MRATTVTRKPAEGGLPTHHLNDSMPHLARLVAGALRDEEEHAQVAGALTLFALRRNLQQRLDPARP